MVAVDLLLGRRPEEPRPDVVVSIVDASNLDRHLYLTTQLLDLGVPVVVALNMIDVAEAQGITIDCAKLSERLGVPVVPIQANKRHRLERTDAGDARRRPRVGTSSARSGVPARRSRRRSRSLQAELGDEVPAFLARRLLLDVGGYAEQWLVGAARRGAAGRSSTAARAAARGGRAARCRRSRRARGTPGSAARSPRRSPSPPTRPVTWTDRLDRVLTHRVWGTLVFLA